MQESRKPRLARSFGILVLAIVASASGGDAAQAQLPAAGKCGSGGGNLCRTTEICWKFGIASFCNSYSEYYVESMI